MYAYDLEVVTDLDEVIFLSVYADSPEEAQRIAKQMLLDGETEALGHDIISCTVR